MKIIQPHLKLLFFLHALALLACVIGLWFFPVAISSTFDAYWLLLIVALIIVITPLGGRRLQTTLDESPRYPFMPWILRIFTIELSLLAIYLGISTLNGTVLPVLTPLHPHLFAHTLHYSLLHLGLFPWVGFALLGCGFGYCSYHRKEDAYFSATLNPLIKSTPTRVLGVIANATARSATAFALASTLALMSLLLANLFLPATLLHNFSGFNPIAMFTMIIVLITVFRKKFNVKIRSFTIEKRIPPIVIFGLSTLLLAIVMTTLVLFFGGTMFNPIKTPRVLTALLHNGWEPIWKIFISFWWLSWTPLIGVFIAKISKGYSVRAIILATLALPAFISAFMIITDHHPLHSHAEYFSPVLASVLSIIGFMLILSAVARKKSFTSLMQAYLPKDDHIKYRAHDRFITKLLQNTTVLLCLYLPSGVLILSALFFIFTVGFSLLMLVLPLALIPLLR